MALPRKLKYLNMFNDGLSYMGVVESVTLPKLTRKLENYRGGGMNGAAAIDLGLDDDALTVEWSVACLMWLCGLSTPRRVLTLCRCVLLDPTSATTPAKSSRSRWSCVAVIKKSTAAKISRVKTPRPNCRRSAPITA